MPIAAKPVAETVIALAAQSKAANQVEDIEQKKAAQQGYQQAMNDARARPRPAACCATSIRPTSCARR